MESLRWSVMIFSMAAAGIASQFTSPRTIGLVAGAFGVLTALVWAWADFSGRLPDRNHYDDYSRRHRAHL